MIIYLASNEFTVRDDRVGFLDDGGEVLEYLSLDTFIDYAYPWDLAKASHFYDSYDALPQINFHLELSD